MTEEKIDINEKELTALISLLDDEDVEVSNHVEKKLLSLGTSVIPYLEKEWMNNSLIPDVRSRIEDIIHELQYELLKERLMEWKTTGAENLLEGMMLVANYQYPDLNLGYLTRKLEQFYYEAWKEFNGEYTPIQEVKILNDIIYNRLKFRPNSKNFHSPSNGMINLVMESKKGNPLSLCVIYLLIAQKLKMPIYGVNLPNLFIVTYKTDDTQFYINVFNNGIIFTKADIDNYIEQLHLVKQDAYYQPCSNVDIVSRSLRNLIASFEKLGEYKKSDDIKTLLRIIDDSRD
ncbi:transglutaminase-like domain-containing protein [Reichenbachiella agarivorans]|uniref:Transglutaminase-like domain-containing protein n=1 Tax=Reichenbachiella agarivorans TaxID=2979464 RepID=A0ABY6CPI1_9BACT|nr:transglutaminase-like domain-containing protein [Reichenbachiella agarivorans]UXP31945.1 transglutaminase-like domain-containing protein [Reichenbachiella agarivorans]